MAYSTISEELFGGYPNVGSDLPKKAWRYISTLVNGDRRGPAVGLPELLVRAALPDLGETECMKNFDDLLGFENRKRAHCYATKICCVPMNSPPTSGASSSSSISITS